MTYELSLQRTLYDPSVSIDTEITKQILPQIPDVIENDRRLIEVSVKKVSADQISNFLSLRCRIIDIGCSYSFTDCSFLGGVNFKKNDKYLRSRNKERIYDATIEVSPSWFRLIRDIEECGYSDDYIIGQLAAYCFEAKTIKAILKKAKNMEFNHSNEVE